MRTRDGGGDKYSLYKMHMCMTGCGSYCVKTKICNIRLARDAGICRGPCMNASQDMAIKEAAWYQMIIPELAYIPFLVVCLGQGQRYSHHGVCISRYGCLTYMAVLYYRSYETHTSRRENFGLVKTL
jgi:hypothetical protein